MNRILCLVAALLVGASAAANAPQLNPEPRQMTGEYERIALPEGGVRIVLGTRASDPEEYAAERLQALAQRRLHSLWPIVRESPSLPDGDWRVLVGRTESHDALSAAWDAAGFTMPEAAFAPGRDGFAIEVLPAERLVLVAGANERGVIYGVQALVQLLRADGNNTTMPLVSVRDWASIPWRGRKHIQRFPTTDELDAFMWARLNYSILMPDKTDAETRALLREARRRGIFVYANILCAVGPEAFDATVDRTREFIAMGVDGLHFSFDDDGPGQETHLLMRRLLDLGREHGITGRAISITSIPGGYTNINNSFNRERVQIPGMEEAIWFFTRVPAREDVEQARALGLRTLPAWHHNWPRVRGGGFTHASGGGASFMIERHAGFVGVPPLTHGWGEPEYEDLRDAAQYIDTVHAHSGRSPQVEITFATMGFWAWNPETHDYDRTRQHIYEHIYGPSSTRSMLRFEDEFARLKQSFFLPWGFPTVREKYPPRLRPDADLDMARRSLAEMERILDEIEEHSPRETSLTVDRLTEGFLRSLRTELSVAATLVQLEFPEDWWPAVEGEALARYTRGDIEGAKQLLAEAAPGLDRQIDTIAKDLSALRGIETTAFNLTEERLAQYRRQGIEHWYTLLPYAPFWRERAKAANAGDLQRVNDLFIDRVGITLLHPKPEQLVAAAAAPPEEGHLAAGISPGDLMELAAVEQQGVWGAGLYREHEHEAIFLAYPVTARTRPGDYCRVTFTLPVPPANGRLEMQIFLNDSRAGIDGEHRAGELLLNGQESGLLIPNPEGEARTAWRRIDLSRFAEPGGSLEVTLLLSDLKERTTDSSSEILAVGPIRFVEVIEPE